MISTPEFIKGFIHKYVMAKLVLQSMLTEIILGIWSSG